MRCSEFREAAGADPQHLQADALAHQAQCSACAAYLQQMLQLDALLKRAMEIAVPVAQPAIAVTPRTTSRWFAMAASVLVALVVGMGAWLAVPSQSLAADVVQHVLHEEGIMISTDDRVDAEKLQAALARSGVHLRSGAQQVSVVRTCLFHGRVAPHLIVQTQGGPVTVLVLADEKVKDSQSFDEQGYHGVIVPLTPGSPGAVAIVASNDAALHEASATVASQVEWTATH